MQKMNFVDALTDWCAAASLKLDGSFAVRFGQSEDGRPKSSAWVNVEAHGKSAELIVWSSGEAEVSFQDLDGAWSDEHYDFDSVGQMVDVLDLMMQRVGS
ncbi:hypothetical protein [Crossiella sp. CA198]|uniref:hypothetical protein n=1 Tax=Crossiella sp. CA198 TaxID=3455607 RepID=UPI003F8D2351